MNDAQEVYVIRHYYTYMYNILLSFAPYIFATTGKSERFVFFSVKLKLLDNVRRKLF